MILELKNIQKQFLETNFKLENINIKLYENEVIGLIGQNGSGKSTILKMMNQLEKQDSGQLYYDGIEVNGDSESQLRVLRKKVAYIFQSGHLLEKQSVYYHLSLVYKLNKQKVNEKEINEILSFFSLTSHKKSKVYYLSGGQKQKVAIAMAILSKPKVLLCDEISSQLDYKSENEIFDLLKKIKEKYALSLVVVSHNLAVLKSFCDRVYMIDKYTITKEIIPNHNIQNQSNSYHEFVEEYLND